MRKKELLLFALLIFITISSSAFERVPKQKTFEIGYRYIGSATFDIKNMGPTLLFDYAWQLSGFEGKPAAYISVPLGYTSLMMGDSGAKASILSYGWTVRHNLKSKSNRIPFFGYGLLLNQLRIDELPGTVFGHQTRFDYGCTFKPQSKYQPFVKIEYSYTRYPSLTSDKSDTIHAFELKGGFRF